MNSIFRQLLILCALALFSTSGYAQEAACRDCTNTRVITKADFCRKGKHSNSIVIRKPGNYCLAETINWCPRECNKTAIIIDASNVTLDLSGHELKQVNHHGRCSGILIKSGQDTVKIVNGAVRDFTQLGIVVEGDTSNIFLGNDDTVLKVTGCGYGSSQAFFDPSTNTPLLQGGILFGQSKSFESQGYYTYKGKIETAVLTNVFAEENSPAGMYMGIGSDISVNSCYFCRNSDTRIAGNPNPIAIGGFVDDTVTLAIGVIYNGSQDFGDEDSTTFTFQNCHFDDNSSSGDTPLTFGFDAGYNLHGLTLRNCTFNANNGSGATNSNGFGIFGCLMGGNKDVLVEDCESVDNSSEYYTAGFHHSGRNLSFDPETVTPGEGLVYRRCNSSGNNAAGDFDFVGSVGFEFYFALGLTIEECTSMNSSATALNPVTYAFQEGLILGGNARLNAPLQNAAVSGCHIAGNTVEGEGDIEGILLLGPCDNIVIQNSVIQNNVGAGFDIGVWTLPFGDISSIVVDGLTIESEMYGIYSNGDTNSIFQNNTITDVENGIVLDTSTCDSVNNNYVTNAFSGFVDTQNPSTSLFSNNRVFGAVTPYDVTYTFGPVPVVSGSLVTGFPTGAEVLDNVFMDNPTCRAAPVAAALQAKSALKTRAAAALKARKARLGL